MVLTQPQRRTQMVYSDWLQLLRQHFVLVFKKWFYVKVLLSNKICGLASSSEYILHVQIRISC